jgi:hypothetical protein
MNGRFPPNFSRPAIALKAVILGVRGLVLLQKSEPG